MSDPNDNVKDEDLNKADIKADDALLSDVKSLEELAERLKDQGKK